MDEAQAKFTHSTALIIHLWSALDIAVQNEWAGPESSNIRDWLGGVIVDMFSFPAQKKVDVEDVEDVLLQVLEDEFELRLEDDSAYQVAGDIVKSYEQCLKGDFQHVGALEEIYQSLKKRPRGDKVVQPPSQVDGDDESGDEMDEEENEIQDGQAMAVDASPREDANLPIVDEDGFQLVQGKGRRRR